MKYFIWILSSINIYLGLRFFLNVIGFLQTSKYSQAATAVYAVVFLGMGAAGFYYSIIKTNLKLALLIGFGPWVILLLLLLITLMTSDYK